MGKTILVADDDPILRELAGEFLRDAGFAVDLAEDGEQALAMLTARPYDLVVTDMVMPNVDGLELITEIRRTAPATPLVAISAGVGGRNADVLLRAAQAAGAASVLEKPLKRADLLRAVVAAFDGRR